MDSSPDSHQIITSHQKLVKESSIRKIETEHGSLTGHSECAKYLEEKVAEFLLTPLPLGQTVFTDGDNEMLLAVSTTGKVKEVLADCHLPAAPGTDSIPSLVEMVQAIYAGSKPIW